LATWLDAAEKEDAFDRLVLVAAPKTLGEIRPLLSEGVQARVMAQLNKDLASQPDHKIQEQLTKIVWF
jgi:protein required for attachment to host cells